MQSSCLLLKGRLLLAKTTRVGSKHKPTATSLLLHPWPAQKQPGCGNNGLSSAFMQGQWGKGRGEKKEVLPWQEAPFCALAAAHKPIWH